MQSIIITHHGTQQTHTFNYFVIYDLFLTIFGCGAASYLKAFDWSWPPNQMGQYLIDVVSTLESTSVMALHHMNDASLGIYLKAEVQAIISSVNEVKEKMSFTLNIHKAKVFCHPVSR